MGTQTDAAQLAADLDRALPLLARDALAAAMAAGTLPGPEGLALSAELRRIAAAELADVERLAARIASLGETPSADVPAPKGGRTWKAVVKGLAEMQREALDAVVAAIPADADDAEGEATEHLLEHVVARKRDAIELLERALR
jgi:bacterioferritin (cytochrome b1)